MRPKHLAQRTTTAKPTRDIASRDFRRFASLHTDRKGRGDCRPWGRASSKAEVARFKVCASKICKAVPRHANHVYQKHLNLWKKKSEKLSQEEKLTNKKGFRTHKSYRSLEIDCTRLSISRNPSGVLVFLCIHSQTSPFLGQPLFHYVKMMLNRPTCGKSLWSKTLLIGTRYSDRQHVARCCQSSPDGNLLNFGVVLLDPWPWTSLPAMVFDVKTHVFEGEPTNSNMVFFENTVPQSLTVHHHSPNL